MSYTIRLPANRVLQERIGYLLKRPVGRPWQEVRRYYASFSYQAQSWKKTRRLVAKVEWHPGELYPRVGFIFASLARPAERIVAFYNQRGTCEQFIKKGKGAIKWTRLSSHTFAANAVRLQLYVLAYNLGSFMRTLAMPRAAQPWPLTSLREKLTRASMMIARGQMRQTQRERCAVVNANQRVPAPRGGQSSDVRPPRHPPWVTIVAPGRKSATMAVPDSGVWGISVKSRADENVGVEATPKRLRRLSSWGSVVI
jgi:hypothetical protein